MRDGQDVGPGGAGPYPDRRSEDPRHYRRSAPRAELFRGPYALKDKGTLAEITGTVSLRRNQGQRSACRLPIRMARSGEELVPKERNMLVHEGQVVNKGEVVVDGPADPQDILRLLGAEELARYIVDERSRTCTAAGCEDQRQAHRGDRAPDAAPCGG